MVTYILYRRVAIRKNQSSVFIYLRDAELHVYDDQRQLLCVHTVIITRGRKIINVDHKRDKSQQINDLIAATAAMFTDRVMALEYFELIRLDKKRYLRDQVQAIRNAVQGCDKQVVAAVLQKCIAERYLSAGIFRELLIVHEAEKGDSTGFESSAGKVILLDPDSTRKAETRPDKSDLDAYEKAFSNT